MAYRYRQRIGGVEKWTRWFNCTFCASFLSFEHFFSIIPSISFLSFRAYFVIPSASEESSAWMLRFAQHDKSVSFRTQ